MTFINSGFFIGAASVTLVAIVIKLWEYLKNETKKNKNAVLWGNPRHKKNSANN